MVCSTLAEQKCLLGTACFFFFHLILLCFQGVSGSFQGCSRASRTFQGFPRGFKSDPGVFQRDSGFKGVPGLFEAFQGRYRGVPMVFHRVIGSPMSVPEVSRSAPGAFKSVLGCIRGFQVRSRNCKF